MFVERHVGNESVLDAAMALSHFARHDEKRLHFEAFVVGPQAVDVVLLLYVYNFF